MYAVPCLVSVSYPGQHGILGTRLLQCQVCSVLITELLPYCRDFEGQQQKLVSDHDAHPREEPEFPELAKIVNRYLSRVAS